MNTPYAAIAPGSLITITGTNLAEVTSPADSNPYPLTLGNAKVTIGGLRAPIAFVSPTSITVLVPSALKVNTPHEIFVERASKPSAGVYVDTAPAQPAIFTDQDTGFAKVFLQDDATIPAQFVTPKNPASAGDKLLIHCAGLGPVQPQPPDGAQAPDSAPVATSPVFVLFGDVSTVADSAILVPGAVGVYQVQVTVPENVPSGSVNLAVKVLSQTSSRVNISIQ